MARNRGGSDSPEARWQGRCERTRRRCRFLLADGREWCHRHQDQAAEAIGAPLTQLEDSAISLRQLGVWARELDAIGQGGRSPASSFVHWLAAKQQGPLVAG
jgi:hypothetical protein